MATKDKTEQQGFITVKLSTGTLYIAEKYKVFINNKKNGEDIEIYSKDNDEWIPLDERVTNAIYKKIKNKENLNGKYKSNKRDNIKKRNRRI